MKTISIASENGETFSPVSNFFIDYYMAEANGEFVKIYLYLLRLMQVGRPVSLQAVADHFQCTQRDICRAIRYWVDRHILRLEYNQKGELLGITILRLVPPEVTEDSERNSGLELLRTERIAAPEPSGRPSSASAASDKVYSLAQTRPPVPDAPDSERTIASADTEPAIPIKKTYSSAQLERMEGDRELENILYQFEMYCGHTPTQTEFRTLLYIYDQLHFPAELLEYLIEYCASLEHTSNRYMEKVAIDWYGRNIRTAEQAKQETAAYHALNTAISREMGLTRVLTPTELRYINTWKNDYAFQQDIIIEACQRASADNKLTFRYVNGILSSWHDSQVKNLDDVRRLDELHRARKKTAERSSQKVKNLPFNSFEQRSYDNQELENFFIQEVEKLSKHTDTPS